MKRSTDIESYNKIVQMDRVYTLSDGLDDMLNKIQSDVLRTDPLPSIEKTFAYFCREAIQHVVMNSPSGTVYIM